MRSQGYFNKQNKIRSRGQDPAIEAAATAGPPIMFHMWACQNIVRIFQEIPRKSQDFLGISYKIIGFSKKILENLRIFQEFPRIFYEILQFSRNIQGFSRKSYDFLENHRLSYESPRNSQEIHRSAQEILQISRKIQSPLRIT